jgi:hypothetical protein
MKKKRLLEQRMNKKKSTTKAKRNAQKASNEEKRKFLCFGALYSPPHRSSLIVNSAESHRRRDFFDQPGYYQLDSNFAKALVRNTSLAISIMQAGDIDKILFSR